MKYIRSSRVATSLTVMKYIRSSRVDTPLTLTTYDIGHVDAGKRNNVKIIPYHSSRGNHIFVQADLFTQGYHRLCIYVTITAFERLGIIS